MSAARRGLDRRPLVLAGLVLSLLSAGTSRVAADGSGGPESSPVQHNVLVRWASVGVPAVDGDTIAFPASNFLLGKKGPAYMELLAIGSGRMRPLTEAQNSGDPFQSTRLSLKWVVFLGGGNQGPWNLSAVNVGTGRRIKIDSSPPEGLPPTISMTPDSAVSGNTVVWTVTTCSRSCYDATPNAWRSSVMMRTLPNGRPHRLYETHAPCTQAWPSIAAGLVVWMQMGTCPGKPWARYGSARGDNLLSYDVKTRRLRQLTRDGLASMPTTNGRYVAWKESGSYSGQGAIVLLDRTTGSKRIVSRRLRHSAQDPRAACRASSAWPWSSCDDIPYLLRNALVYYADGGTQIASYGLVTRRRDVLARTSRKSDPSYATASPDSDYAVWITDDCASNSSACKRYISYAKLTG